MKQFLVLLVALFLVGCGDDPRDNMTGSEPTSNYYDNYDQDYGQGINNGEYYWTDSEYNRYVFYRPYGSAYVPPYWVNLHFSTRNVRVSVIAGNVSIGRDIQVQIYGADNSLLATRNLNVSGSQTNSFTLRNLRMVPNHVVFDCPNFSGSLQIMLESVN